LEAVSDAQDQRRRRCTIVHNIHNDRDGNGVDAVYYTRLAVSESPIPHNSGDETLTHVSASRDLFTRTISIIVYEINYVIYLPIFKTISGEKKVKKN